MTVKFELLTTSCFTPGLLYRWLLSVQVQMWNREVCTCVCLCLGVTCV